MDSQKDLWELQQKLLRSMLLKPDNFDDAINLCLDQHAMVHSSEMSQINAVTFEDELWEDLDETVFRTMPTVKDETIAWSLWHLTRIEDITMNILVADEKQVINRENWLEKMNIKVCDTGNSMTDEEIIDLSLKINMQELRKYRIAVGRKSREIIRSFQPADLKRKMEPARLRRVLDERAVLNVDGAHWLVDFWGRKNVAGILLMPLTRHQKVHINESMRLKRKCHSIGYN
ncbi:DinB family protein [Sporomusa malonica]|uniref:DinB superfamily protein n=1 Tax=Sporomusa malonica TaxID=112901 RepID=A0A1W2F095_9FIRM|nr:DinB family protein [Sporomusa malonica]SMD15324.1 DinB superfamily protein [Sporomusa malonica]